MSRLDLVVGIQPDMSSFRTALTVSKADLPSNIPFISFNVDFF